MDCLKRFRRKKQLLVGKLAVMCMQIALSDKTSVLKTTLWLNLCKGKLAGVWGGGIAPSQKFFSILSLKMTTFSAFWVLAHAARGASVYRLMLRLSNSVASIVLLNFTRFTLKKRLALTQAFICYKFCSRIITFVVICWKTFAENSCEKICKV